METHVYSTSHALASEFSTWAGRSGSPSSIAKLQLNFPSGSVVAGHTSVRRLRSSLLENSFSRKCFFIDEMREIMDTILNPRLSPGMTSLGIYSKRPAIAGKPEPESHDPTFR